MPVGGFFLFDNIQKRSGPFLVALALTSLVAGVASSGARADQVDTLSATLERDGDDKARIAAAVALGRLADRRSVPALSHALSDRSAVVRAVAATALGHIGDPRAIPALEAALKDESLTVRTRTTLALEKLQQRKMLEEPPRPSALLLAKPSARAVVVVKTMSLPGEQGSKELTLRMRELVLEALRRSPDVALDKASAPRSASEFYLDGVMTKMTVETSGRWIEISCHVKLTVSTEKGRIVSIVSGGATVQTPKSAYRKDKELALKIDALASAIQGAEQNLLSFLGQRVAAVP